MPRVNRQHKAQQPEEDLSSLAPMVAYDENEDAPFERAYILPIGTKTIEVSLTPRGREVEDEIKGKVCGKILITLPKTRLGERGIAQPVDVAYAIDIPGRTDNNEAIRDRQPLREVNRALYFGSGNGTLYRLEPISKQQYAEERKVLKEKETQDALRRADQRRRSIPEPLSMNAKAILPGSNEEQSMGMAERALHSIGA